ncbi:MAG: hypothetical protein ACTSO9_18090 [Candidatus Helarchaeota archaeon]
MNLLIDTCTWLKLDILKEDRIFEPDKIYNWANIGISHQVLKEIEHFNCKSFKKEKTQINPIQNEEIYKKALKLEFDEADASILSFGKKTGDSIIISEDGTLLEYARINKFYALQLIDLFLLFTSMNFMKPRDLYHITKYLRKLKNITKKKEKEILIKRLTLKKKNS